MKHQCDVLLVVHALDHSDGVLESFNSFLNVLVLEGVVAVDLAELLHDYSQVASFVDDLRVSTFVVNLDRVNAFSTEFHEFFTRV